MPHVDAALNLTWLSLGVTTLLYQWWRERHLPQDRSGRLRHALVVFVALLALFPSISASDDAVRFRDLHRQLTQHAAFDRTRTDVLPLLFQQEDLEHGQVSSPVVLLLELTFLLVIALEQRARATFRHRDSLSRAPPLAA